MFSYPALLDLATQKLHPLGTSESFLVGRVETADVCLFDQACSRQHFRIIRQNGQYHVEALNAVNPTCLNGQVVTRVAPLEHGAVLQAGPTRFQFLLRPSGEETAQTAANAMPLPVAVPAGLAAPGEPAPSLPTRTGPSRQRRRAMVLLAGCSVLLVAGLVTVVVLLRQGSSRTSAGQDDDFANSLPTAPPPRKLTAHEKAVSLAVKNGAAYLKKRLLEGKLPTTSTGNNFADTQLGVAALMGLALLEAGIPPSDPAVKEALAKVHQEKDRLTTVYVLGTTLFFLNRLHEAGALDESGKTLVRNLALRLIAGQLRMTSTYPGMWNYTCPPISADAQAQLLKKLQDGQYEPAAPGPYSQANYGSNSLTQFAMLALWGARKCDVPVRAPLLKAALQYHTTQKEDGSWVYDNVRQQVCADTNTCAGLLGLALEQALREDKEFAGDRTPLPPPDPKVGAMRQKAFARLSKVIGQKKDPGPRYFGGGKLFGADTHSDCYFLWCLERVAVIYDKKEIEGKDWYKWGSDALLKSQKEDGSWVDGYDATIDTCFAILFLKRANLAKDLTDKLRLLLVSARPALPPVPRREA